MHLLLNIYSDLAKSVYYTATYFDYMLSVVKNEETVKNFDPNLTLNSNGRKESELNVLAGYEIYTN